MSLLVIEDNLAKIDLLNLVAIKSFRHGGLRRFFERGDVRRLHPAHVARISGILAALERPDGLALLAGMPEYRLHRLAGDRKGQWSAKVSRQWRIVFRFEVGDAYDVELVDYD